MKKVVIVFAIVGLVSGVAYASFDDLRELNKEKGKLQSEKKASMSEARAEIDAEFQERTEQKTPSLRDGRKPVSNYIGILIGVVVGAILSWFPICWQLKHDSKEKDKERKMSLRRDVYLSAVAKIGKQLFYLANFYDTSRTPPEDYDEAIGQINVVGSDETVAALNQFNDHMIETFTELIPIHQEICILKDRNESLPKLAGHFAGQGLGIEKLLQEYKRIHGEQIELTYDLAEKCQQKGQLADELLTPLIVAIRKEMSTPFDEAAFRSMMETSHKKWKENIEKYTTSMKDTHKQGIQSFLTDINRLIPYDTDKEEKTEAGESSSDIPEQGDIQ